MKLRANIRPYFQKIADYYWEELQYNGPHMSIWDWLLRDYNVVKMGPIGSKSEIWVSFPNEQHMTMFMLRWS